MYGIVLFCMYCNSFMYCTVLYVLHIQYVLSCMFCTIMYVLYCPVCSTMSCVYGTVLYIRLCPVCTSLSSINCNVVYVLTALYVLYCPIIRNCHGSIYMGDLVAGLFLSYVLNSEEICDILWFPQLFFYIG